MKAIDLKRKMKELNLTAYQLCQLTGVNAGNLSRFLNGRQTSMKLETIIKIENALEHERQRKQPAEVAE